MKILRDLNQILLLLALFLTNACNSTEGETNEFADGKADTLSIAENEPVIIRYTPAIIGSFPLRTFSTGSLQATLQTDLKIKTSGLLIRLEAVEQKRLKKGDIVAQLDNSSLQLQLELAKLHLEEVTFNKHDMIALRGGKFGDEKSVSAEVLSNIEVQCGVKKAHQAIKQIEYEIGQMRLYAPFSGIVADVKVRPHQQINSGETLCRLIDPLSFEAIFFMLEKEALLAGIGQPVRVQPVADSNIELQATVSAINPVVDERGLVRLHARIRPDDLRRYAARLLEGMNIRVVLEKRIPNRLIVPKSAVVLRSGKPVVFTYDKELGLAKWNYVTVLHENDNQAAIGEGLSAGDIVIYSGNLNLDHDAKVVPDSTFIQHKTNMTN